MADYEDDDYEGDDPLDAFGITLETVQHVISLARAFDSGEALLSASDEDETAPQRGGISPERELRSTIRDMNQEEQVALVTLLWLGRGDYDPDQWEQALKDAGNRYTRHADSYLIETPQLGDLLEEGLAAVGVPIEELEETGF